MLTPLFDDDVNIINNGKTGSFSRDEAANELLKFFNTDRLSRFNLKHQGTSSDGQVFIIGRLYTHAGKNMILCAGPKIFRPGTGFLNSIWKEKGGNIALLKKV